MREELEDLNLTPSTHSKLEGGNWLHRVSSDLHVYAVAHMCSNTHHVHRMMCLLFRYQSLSMRQSWIPYTSLLQLEAWIWWADVRIVSSVCSYFLSEIGA